MIRVLLAAALACVCLVAAGAQPTDPILGTYRVEGADPNGPYRGTVAVSKAGEALRADLDDRERRAGSRVHRLRDLDRARLVRDLPVRERRGWRVVVCAIRRRVHLCMVGTRPAADLPRNVDQDRRRLSAARPRRRDAVVALRPAGVATPAVV